MIKEIRKRLKWIQLYGETLNAGLVYRRCGIFRPALRTWLRCYEGQSLDGLNDAANRSHNSPYAGE